METVTLLDYGDIRKRLGDFSTCHLLLGNGFSRAWRNDLFAYDALYQQAKALGLTPELEKVFDALGTKDFETVMRALRQSAALAASIGKGYPKLAGRLREYADDLRELLVKTIAGNHPERPHDVSEQQYHACREFLLPFKNTYTLNYDLLLYWTVMQDAVEPHVPKDDGFRQPEDGPEDYVTWDTENSDSQNIFYLHGALHLFDAGHELQKYTWCNTGVALIDQIRTALKAEHYPHFVSEGSSSSKYARIQHSNYLGRGFRSFAKIGGALVVFGHSMAENDEHIIRRIESRKSTIKYLAVSLFGDPKSAANQKIILRCQRIIAARHDAGRTTDLDFFDAASAQVWGAQ